MTLQKSIQTSVIAGVPSRITITVTASTNIIVEYNGVQILASTITADTTVITADSTIITVDTGGGTLVTDSYSFDYIPSESGGILSVYTDEVTEGTISGSISINNVIPNYHTPYNNGASVIAFKEDVNGWTSTYSFTPEYMVSLDDDLYSFRWAEVYKHNTDNDAEFYGVQYPSVIGFKVVGAAGVVKIAEYMSIESNIKPDYIHIMTTNPYTQATDLCPGDLVYAEGTYFGSFFRDKLSPNITAVTESEKFVKALLDGDQMRAKYFNVFMIFNNLTPFELLAVNVGLTTSSGHRKQ